MTLWPEVTYTDIVNYLVYTQSAYTLSELKAYKSLQSYNYFVSGFVQDISHKKINDISVFLGKVKHSQRMNETSLRPWLIVEGDGSVIAGHCTCMAGIGEVCSHAGALLFAIEASVKIRNSKTVTEEKAYWMLPNTVNKVDYKKIQKIDFTSAKTKKRKLDECISGSTPASNLKKKKSTNVPEPTPNELNAFFTDLSRSGTKPVILSLVPQYASSYRPAALDKKYPVVFSGLFDENNCGLDLEEIIHKSEITYNSIKVSEEEAINCEIATKNQCNNRQWFNFRAGRITASRAKRCCRTKPNDPSISLVKDICYPLSKTFSSAQTKWGCNHEREAKLTYVKLNSKNHVNFNVKDSGFVINPKYPFMGASPDGVVTCDCCEDVLLEVKCPYCQRSSLISDAVDCLKMVDGQLQLDKQHSYFYQVQCQMLVSEIQACDFVVWTESDFFVERIAFDEQFCQDMIEKCTVFFKEVLLPELIRKYFSTRPLKCTDNQKNCDTSSSVSDSQLIICSCRQPYNEQTDNVIGCDNENCPYIWLHFKCAGIKRIPKGQWFCKNCRK